jgi:hypothetical protein
MACQNVLTIRILERAVTKQHEKLADLVLKFLFSELHPIFCGMKSPSYEQIELFVSRLDE